MRGTTLDLPLIMMLALVFCISVLVVYLVLAPFVGTELDNSGIITLGLSSLQLLDSLCLFFVIGFSLAIIVSSFLIKSHPIFFIFSVLGLIVSIIVSALFSNLFGEFIADPMFSGIASNFPIMQIIFSNLPTIIFIIGLIVLVVLHGKEERV